jgi:hypothetical protein
VMKTAVPRLRKNRDALRCTGIEMRRPAAVCRRRVRPMEGGVASTEESLQTGLHACTAGGMLPKWGNESNRGRGDRAVVPHPGSLRLENGCAREGADSGRVQSRPWWYQGRKSPHFTQRAREMGHPSFLLQGTTVGQNVHIPRKCHPQVVDLMRTCLVLGLPRPRMKRRRDYV